MIFLMKYLLNFHKSCTTAATLKAPFWRRSASSSNNRAVRQPQPFGAFGKSVPVCLKLPNTMTSLFDGHISCIIRYRGQKKNSQYTLQSGITRTGMRPTIILFTTRYYLVAGSNLFTRIDIHLHLFWHTIKNLNQQLYIIRY